MWTFFDDFYTIKNYRSLSAFIHHQENTIKIENVPIRSKMTDITQHMVY